MYLLHRSVGPSVQFLYSGCMIAAKFRIMTIEQRAVRGTAENFVICDTQKSYSENLFRRLSFQFHVFHDIENLKIAAKSMQVNILLIGEEYGKEDRDEILARQKYLLIGEKIPSERSPTENPFFRYQSVSSMLELLLQEKDQENSEVQTHQIQLVSDRSQTVKANVNGLIGISHDEQVFVAACEKAREFVLFARNVLKFVYLNVFEFVRPLFEDRRILFKEK